MGLVGVFIFGGNMCVSVFVFAFGNVIIGSCYFNY